MISLKTKEWQIDNIDTVLFDKDGTFIDLHYFWGKMTQLRCEEIIRKFNLNSKVQSELCLCLGYDVNNKKMLKDGITALYSRSKIIEIFKGELVNFGVNISEQNLADIFDKVSEIFYKDMFKYTKPINEAIEFIKKLKEYNIKTAIVTSDSVESTRLTLEHFKWNDLFDTYVGRESSKQTKESGALTYIALNNLNSKPEATVMIGDAPMDFLSAKNAGVEKTILVPTGQIVLEDLKTISNFTVESLDKIKITPL